LKEPAFNAAPNWTSPKATKSLPAVALYPLMSSANFCLMQLEVPTLQAVFFFVGQITIQKIM
jgi:hypothetical protein